MSATDLCAVIVVSVAAVICVLIWAAVKLNGGGHK